MQQGHKIMCYQLFHPLHYDLNVFSQVKAVKLKSGITIEADLLIVGIGM